MAQIPPVDLANHLAAAGIGLIPGSNLFVSPVLPASEGVAQDAVFILGYGGPPPARVLQGGPRQEIRRARVQVRVRSASIPAGLERCRAIYNAVESAAPPGYMDVVALQSEPMYLEQDDNGAHHWVLNFELTYQAEE